MSRVLTQDIEKVVKKISVDSDSSSSDDCLSRMSKAQKPKKAKKAPKEETKDDENSVSQKSQDSRSLRSKGVSKRGKKVPDPIQKTNSKDNRGAPPASEEGVRMNDSNTFEESKENIQEPDEISEGFKVPEATNKLENQAFTESAQRVPDLACSLKTSTFQSSLEINDPKRGASQAAEDEERSNLFLASQSFFEEPSAEISVIEEGKDMHEHVMMKFKMNKNGEEKVEKLEEAFKDKNPEIYQPIIMGVAEKYTYTHVFLVPPQSQPFVNILTDEGDFFDFMQKLYNSEIEYKYKDLLQCNFIKEEEILIDVKTSRKEKRPKKDSRKAYILIGKKEDVLAFERFVTEQLGVMSDTNQEKIGYNHSKVRKQDIQKIIEEFNPSPIGSNGSASTSFNSNAGEMRIPREENKEETVDFNDPRGLSSGSLSPTKTPRRMGDKEYGFYLRNNEKDAIINVYSLLSDRYSVYWGDRLGLDLKDTDSFPLKILNPTKLFLSIKKC